MCVILIFTRGMDDNADEKQKIPLFPRCDPEQVRDVQAAGDCAAQHGTPVCVSISIARRLVRVHTSPSTALTSPGRVA